MYKLYGNKNIKCIKYTATQQPNPHPKVLKVVRGGLYGGDFSLAQTNFLKLCGFFGFSK